MGRCARSRGEIELPGKQSAWGRQSCTNGVRTDEYRARDCRESSGNTQQGKTQAAKIEIEIAQAQYENYQLIIATLFANQLQEYYKYKGMVDYYETQGLAVAEQLVKFAEKSYNAGEIGYVEYIRNMEQGTDIKTKYLDNLNQFNQTIIDLQYLVGQLN